MTLARLPVTFFVVVVSLLQDTQGQQCGLCSNSNSGFGNSISLSSEPLIGVITPIKRNSLNNCKCGSNEANLDIQNTKSITSGLQQFLSLQPPHQSSSTGTLNLQPLTGNIQSAFTSQSSQQQQQSHQQQNVKQSVIPVQQTSKPSCSFQFVNEQQPHIQIQPSCLKQSQNLQTSSKLQPDRLEKLIQQQFISGGLQEVQQTPVQKDISLDYLPIVNRQVQGLPSQVTEGMLLSNLGLKSNLPSILPSYTKPSVNTDYIISPQNTAGSSNAQALIDGSQIVNSLPISLSQLPNEYDPNKLTPIFLMPLSFQSGNLESNPQTLDLTLTPVSTFQYQQPQDKVSVISQQPLQTSQTVKAQNQYVQVPIQTYPVQQYAAQNQEPPIQQLAQQPTPVNQSQHPIQPVQSQKTQSQGVPSLSNPSPRIQTRFIQENETSPAQNPQMQMPLDGQSDPLVSLLLSQLQSSNSPSQGSKSSSMKSLLPILFDLLKDKNGGCRCPNCNCGCMNNGQDIQGMNPCINNPLMQNYYNSPTNNAHQTEKQEDPTTNTYLIISNTPQKADIEKTNEFKPQITDGYAKQIKYGQAVQKHVSQNVIDTEESIKKVHDKKKAPIKEYQYQNFKKVTNESAEYENDDDYAYSYENED